MAEGVCAGCGEQTYLKAKGYCRKCYQQWKRTGSVERHRMPRGLCTVPDCEQPAHGRGMCHMHLRRLKVSGSLDDPRADNYLLGSNNTVYQIWLGYRKPGAPPMHPTWLANVLDFEEGVGKKPSDKHRLYRIDKSKPMEPGNFEWRQKIDVQRHNDETTGEYNYRYRQERRRAEGTSMWNGDLLRKYGLTKKQHQAIGEAQRHLCAISGRPEDRVKAGKALYLVMDHTERADGTKVVRQLLRGACNTLIGLAGEDPMILAKAILYLGKHDLCGPEAGQRAVDEAVAYLRSWPIAELEKSAILPQHTKGQTDAN